VITKLSITGVQEPDATRSRPAGQTGSYKRIWLKTFNEKSLGQF
jgi:hypothetical protein